MEFNRLRYAGVVAPEMKISRAIAEHLPEIALESAADLMLPINKDGWSERSARCNSQTRTL